MKNHILTIAIVLLSMVSVKAQDPFEGEIDFTTFANFCDYINNNGLMAGGNGIHHQTLTVKGDKGKLVNHTTGSVTIWDLSTGQYMTYVPELKKGIDYSGVIEGIMVLLPRDTKLHGKYPQPIKSNTIAATGATESVDGHECTEVKGTLIREQGGMASKYGIKALYDPSIPVNDAFTTALYGLDIPGLPMKWTYSYDGGHVSMVGELSFYMENTVTDVRPGEVDEDIFVFPSSEKPKRGSETQSTEMMGYKLTKPTNAMGLMSFFKDANKVAKKHIEEEKASGKQAEYEMFQTGGDWDF